MSTSSEHQSRAYWSRMSTWSWRRGGPRSHRWDGQSSAVDHLPVAERPTLNRIMLVIFPAMSVSSRIMDDDAAETTLSVLDLVPIAQRLDRRPRPSPTRVDLARRTEAAGYRRYWIAEHHLNPGVAGTSAGAGDRPRRRRPPSGSASAPAPCRWVTTPRCRSSSSSASLDALHPGRIDLGLGRSGRAPATRRPRRHRTDTRPRRVGAPTRGLLIPAPFSFAELHRIAALRAAGGAAAAAGRRDAGLRRAGRRHRSALLAGTYRYADGVEAHVVPGEGAAARRVDPRQQRRRERRGRRRRAVCRSPPTTTSPRPPCSTPSTRYRAAFRPSARLAQPVRRRCPPTSSSADDDARRASWPTGYGLWVRSIRTGAGAIPFPTPERGAPAPLDATRTAPWCRTASTPSSSARRRRSPTSSRCSRPRPAPTS